MSEAPTLLWEHRLEWLLTAGILGALLAGLLFRGYWNVGSRGVRIAAGALKLLAILLLALMLLNPQATGTRAKQRANQFAILVDDSQSLNLHDAGSALSRGDQLHRLMQGSDGRDAPWIDKIGRDFDLGEFTFDSQLRPVETYKDLQFTGTSSALGRALENLVKRYQGRPLAGVLLFTDGCATDADALSRVIAMAAAKGDDAAKVPPIYPVLVGRDGPARDISLERLAVSQTNFEDAPVTITAQITTSGMSGRLLNAQLLNNKDGALVEEQTQRVEKDGDPLVVRFRLKPDEKVDQGLAFYKVRVAEKGTEAEFDKPELSDEATLENNSRLAAVDRGTGPYRILYVAGRPNWEYAFMQRALATDAQLQTVAMIRVAKREPKFNFIGHAAAGETVNPLFSGFDNNGDDTQQYDQPVIRVLGASDPHELAAGFPKTAEELFAYNAIIIDDMESEFFSGDQQQLIKDFVRQRGGGLLMLGGVDTFKSGKYDKTVIGDMLPVYMEDPPALPQANYRMALTRDGWLDPWLRLRSDEDAENARLDNMPEQFSVLTPVRGIKPGATVLARAVNDAGAYQPALVEQRFGKGRVDALLIGDLFQWEMHRQSNTDTDFEKAWRQMIRWLVSDVPRRIDVALDDTQRPEDAEGTERVIVQVHDKAFNPLDNATVDVKVTPPDGKSVDLRAQPDEKLPGQYVATYVSRQPGAYRADVTVTGMDGKAVGDARAGWTADPNAEEFRDLQPNATVLERIAKSTGGEVIDARGLDDFADGLPLRQAQVMETYVQPFWHQSWIFLLAIGLLGLEWGLRRFKGLP